MSEKSENNPEAAQDSIEKKFEISRIYVKDISVETPNTPEIFTMDWEPEVQFNLGEKTQVLDEENGALETSLIVTVTTKIGEKVAYVVEVEQAGIFIVAGFEAEDIAYLNNAIVPNVLFPYVRETVSTLIQKAGFPQMLLSHIDFNAVYQQNLYEQVQAAEAEKQAEKTE